MEVNKLTEKEIIRLICSVVIAHIGFIIPIAWGLFFDQNWSYTFPFYDVGTNSYSLNPTDYLTVSSEWFITYVTNTGRPLVYLVLFFLKPNIKVKNIFGNIVYYQIFFEVCLILDLFLTFEQSPLRAILALLISIIYINYLVKAIVVYIYSD